MRASFRSPITMRATLTATLLLSALLAACASNKDAPANKHISQSGPLRVHPGLLGQPVPGETQPAAKTPAEQAAPVEAEKEKRN